MKWYLKYTEKFLNLPEKEKKKEELKTIEWLVESLERDKLLNNPAFIKIWEGLRDLKRVI
jgi:hypothetical protein